MDGKSLNEIASLLEVSKSSVSVWVRDITLNSKQQSDLLKRGKFDKDNIGSQVNEKRYRELRLSYQMEGRIKAQEGSTLHMAGCMLYWAEGSKNRNRLEFVNSDPNMIKMFIQFLREELGVADVSIKVNIHCHQEDPSEQERIGNFWLNLLVLPHSALKNVYIKVGSDSRNNRLQNGVCNLRVESTKYTQHIFGAIQEYGGFENPDWLF
jgi:hypothetical protein